MNIGIFGGTFNPPHYGHLVVAERVREQLGLQKVLFVPSATSPHKQHLDIIDPALRMQMVQLALRGQECFEPSPVEMDRGGVSYTIDTLERIRQEYPGAELYLLIGMDNLDEFDTWKSPEKIVELSTVVVMTRPGFRPGVDEHGIRKSFVFCQVPEIGISSSEIRARVKQGKSIRFLVPEPVEAYIHAHGLYR